LINSEQIYLKANKLINTHDTRNPIKIAKETGIQIMPIDYFNNLLGMYTSVWRNRVIFLNTRMDEYLTKMVAAHELGHDIYHRELAKSEGLKEFELFRMNNSTEYEANAFAAHLLIDTDECLELARDGYDVVQMAGMMNSEINLMLIKLQEMIRLGYEIRLPMEPRGDFFKNIRA